VKILSLGVTQYFTNEVDMVLNLAVGLRLPPCNDDRCTNHIACSQYVELQVFVGFQGYQSGQGCQIFLQVFKDLLCFLSPLELVMFLEELREWESPDAETRDEPAQGSHAPH
jgi:hypothetical protein